ncbi:MAG: protoporphyrinogen oxidase [Gammaproteobacteria bacterium]|nr:protoporphyrinogen oxidase [Gammaproteobacteria bacterium]
MHIAIIGAGISGLATAFYLHRQHPDWQLTLYEAEDLAGGTMRTVDVEGFLFEHGGNGFLTSKPDTLDLVKDAGGEALLMESNDAARIRYIFTDKLHRLPETPPAFLTTRLLSWRGKLRTAAEVFVAPRRDVDDETLKSFGDRRLGAEFTDVFLNAMTAGIYASTPEQISVNAAFPLVVDLERTYGGLFRGMLRKKKKQAGPGGRLMSFTGGVSTFIDHLMTRIPGNHHLGTPVTGVVKRHDGYAVHSAGDTATFDQVVLSTPAHTTAKLLRELDSHLAMQIDAIEYSPVAVVGLGYRHLDHPLDGFGLLTTAASRRQVLGVLWDSSVFPDRVPAGCKAMRVMIGGQRNPELALQDKDALVDTALRGVRETMGVTSPPDVTFVKRWDRGIPNYKVGHLAVVDGVFKKLDRHPGLHLNANAYRGIALNDCVRNARELAGRIGDG